jgi:mannose-6-phosphate isomerase-like protein (cupin superfamily)
MKSFADLTEVPALLRECEHGGQGAIRFRRLLPSVEFQSKIDFVDFTIIPPGSTIGRHAHVANEEVYLVCSGSPIVKVQGEERRLSEGAVAVVRSGEWHELLNDTQQDVGIFIIQVSC